MSFWFYLQTEEGQEYSDFRVSHLRGFRPSSPILAVSSVEQGASTGSEHCESDLLWLCETVRHTAQKFLYLLWTCWFKSLKFFSFTVTGVAQWVEHGLQTKWSLVWFPVRVPFWIAGQVPSGGHMRGNHTLMFLSLSFSHSFLSLKIKNK